MKNLTTTNKNSKLALVKSKTLLNIAYKIVANKSLEDDSWIERLYAWADENNVPDYEFIEDDRCSKGGYYVGIPRTKEKLLNLKVLLLAGYNLKELPSEIGNLTNIGFLHLGANNLKELPKEFENLTNLTFLKLGGNHFKEFPQKIENLTSLKKLDIGGNELTELPQEIQRFTNLIYLHLNENNLKKLPNKITNLTSLKVLDLSGNSMLTLTLEQKTWINELIKNGCEIEMDDELLNRAFFNDKSNQDKFDLLVLKIFERNFELGMCFEDSIEFESFKDGILTWHSTAKDYEKKILISHWAFINMLIKEIFGFDTKLINTSHERQ